MVSAWCEENQLVLVQIKTHEKSNEITAILKLLELLNLGVAFVTIDAMRCQRNICKQIKNRDADYVVGLKSVNMVISQRMLKNHLGQKITSEEKRFYISSLPEDAQRICQIARQHWRLDVVYNEDGACIHYETSAIT